MKRRLIFPVVCAAGFALLAGCVVVPYTPKAEVTPVPAGLDDAEHTWVTVGPRRVLEDIGREVGKLDPQIQLVDGVALRDALFPNGGWTLAALLQEDNRPNLTASGADYLAVIGPSKSGKMDSTGAFAFYLVFLGAQKTTQHVSMSVLLVDLQAGRALESAEIKADGTGTAVGYVYAIIVTPEMDRSLQQGAAGGIVHAVRKVRPNGGVRVGLMAREDGGKDAQATAKVAARAHFLEYTWPVQPSREDWATAFSRLAPEEQARLKGTSVSFGVPAPDLDDATYLKTDTVPAMGLYRLDLPAICDGFSRTYGGGAKAHWQIEKTFTYYQTEEHGDGRTQGFELNWIVRSPQGKTVAVSTKASAPVEKFSLWKAMAGSDRHPEGHPQTNQAFALAFLKLVLTLIADH
jgi:hypothetical protein